MLHELYPERSTIHGHFSRDLPPVVTIDPGDTVRFQCLEAGWSLEPFTGFDAPRRKLEGRQPGELDDGHALTGPVFVRGARPGMTLAVKIERIDVGAWGTTFAGGWESDWNQRLNVTKSGIYHAWTLDRETNTGRNQHGHTVTLRPFMGVYGMPPAEPGVHSTVPPRRTGGNMDCKELIAGTTLYLPIEVDGGLFSVGDGHAVQGDGEISVTAIECPMERVELTFDLLDDMPLTTPVANTPVGWIALGFHRDLDEAAALAVEAMLALMERLHGLTRLDALALASLLVDLRVTQMVNDVRGVHAVLPHGAIK
jgi:acetamidase/formamidase